MQKEYLRRTRLSPPRLSLEERKQQQGFGGDHKGNRSQRGYIPLVYTAAHGVLHRGGGLTEAVSQQIVCHSSATKGWDWNAGHALSLQKSFLRPERPEGARSLSSLGSVF